MPVNLNTKRDGTRTVYWSAVVLLFTRECIEFLSLDHCQCIGSVQKAGTVTRGTKACHGAERPTPVLNYDVDTTKVTPALHMQEVTG
jgi:hypothetical protein